ncbi:nucleotide exchange factor GrpE [Candidatus Roizmanbacteria bacterium]|nr:nucleotide exchange factor GrpE [Candidatus Roizmanbacteria bacterium]
MKKETKNLEVEKLKKEVEEFKNKYLRALADYQNFEKRVGEEKSRLIRTANLNLIMKLLPFLDNLEKAEVFVKDQGLKMAKDHLFQSLKETGVEEIVVLNKPFDPNVAEAIDIVQGDKDDMVVEVLRKGYKLGDSILRVAQVKVSKKVSS